MVSGSAYRTWGLAIVNTNPGLPVMLCDTASPGFVLLSARSVGLLIGFRSPHRVEASASSLPRW